MKTVVLYFPYMINLRAFLAEERLSDIVVDPGDLFLHTSLDEDQIRKACSTYGAVIQ